MRIFIGILLAATTATIQAESYQVSVNYPEVFGVTVTEAEGTTYTMDLISVDSGTTTTATATATSGTAVIVKRNLPVDGRAFTVAIYRDGVKVQESARQFNLFNALGIYPSNFLTALNTEADLAGYNGAQKTAIRNLLEDTAVRMERARIAAEIAEQEATVSQRKALLNE